jgi:hypothetical protein
MKTLYLRNVPEAVGDGLQRLADREGLSVSAFAVRELAVVARRADNAALLGDLPEVELDADDVVADIERGRSER